MFFQTGKMDRLSKACFGQLYSTLPYPRLRLEISARVFIIFSLNSARLNNGIPVSDIQIFAIEAVKLEFGNSFQSSVG